MKVTSNIPEVNPTVRALDMKIGQMGIMDEQIVLRCYECLISLTDPSYTWDAYALESNYVRILPVGTTVTLEIDGTEILNDEEC